MIGGAKAGGAGAADTAVAILVGGRSRRMGGRAKASLPLGNRTVLERVLDAVTPLRHIVYLVDAHGDPPDPDEDLVALLDRLDLPITRDRHQDAGPLGGLDGAFAATDARRVLLLACDLPFVTTAFLAWLIEQSHDQVAAVPAEADGRCHPVCAVYSDACRPSLETALAETRLRASDFVRDVGASLLPRPLWRRFDPGSRLLMNLNDPAAYGQARTWIEAETEGAA